MKKCPSCDRTYPDDETFCEADGVALIKAGPAFVEGSAPTVGEVIECPVCGGRAEPGEVICNFCGARLTADMQTAPSPAPQPSATQRPGQQRTVVASAPPDRFSGRLSGQMLESEPDGEGRGSFTVLGYVAAALVALVGGAWLALHLSSRGPAQEAASASPAAAVTPGPASAAGPLVALASNVPVRVAGESSSAVERSPDAMRKVFDDGKGALLDAYKHALGGDATSNDAMIVRVRIMPDGSVAGAAVRTSTTPNPSLDAEVIRAVSGWSYVPFTGGQVEVDYPIIFAHDATEQVSIESALATRVATLGTNETPEYGSSVAASPAVSSSPAAAAVPTESVAPAAAATPPARAHPRHLARVPRPASTPSLRDRVNEALRSNRSLGRVQFYTNPGGSVVLFGKVFDEKATGVAKQVVRAVPGVTAVVDNLTTDTDTWRQQQAQIQSQLANAGLENVTVRIIGRDAFLSGEVRSDAEKDRAATITEGAAPVVVRTNLITVKPGSVFGF